MPNISISKCDQTMKVGQFIDYSMRIIFIEKWLTKCGGETSYKAVSEKLTLSMSLDQ